MGQLSCGSERTYSGIWHQTTCDDDPSFACHDEIYELHLGRYGENVTGVVVRYKSQSGLDTFQRSFACGCSFIEGGRSREDVVSFGLFHSDTGCNPIPDGVGRGACQTCECTNRLFQLKESDGVLVGTTRCGSGPKQPIRFEPKEGRARRQCVDLVADES
jgi:hypothetical protein